MEVAGSWSSFMNPIHYAQAAENIGTTILFIVL